MTDYLPGTTESGRSENTDFAELLDDLLDIIEHAKSVPLSSSVLISRDEITELLLNAREALPTELARARRLLIERNELWTQAEREANALIDEARSQAAHLVQRTEVVRQANAHAERIVADAQSTAISMRREAEDFIDKKLAAAQIVIDRVARTLAAGREKLQPNLTAAIAAAIGDEGEFEHTATSANGDLFDQDHS